jgi:riboflavin biosynthesis pyrimidine reductase
MEGGAKVLSTFASKNLVDFQMCFSTPTNNSIHLVSSPLAMIASF